MNEPLSWVRMLPKRPGGAYFEAWTPATDTCPDEGFLPAHPEVVRLLFDMQSAVFRAEDALRFSKARIHQACEDIAKAQGHLRDVR